ncbi:MAG: hypothetical protein ACP5HS_10330 [Anaerolineae bacterium]
MTGVIIAFLVFIGVFTFMAYVAGRWLSDYMRRHISGQLDALDQIVNEEQVPDPWLRPFRRRAARLRKSGADEAKLETLKEKARKRSLARMEGLQRYVRETGVTDSEETKRFILKSLEEQETRWRDHDTWDELVDLRVQELERDKDQATMDEV